MGRDADLDRAVSFVESGTGIAILGPAGVGKSRLLFELVDRAGEMGMATFRAVASDSTRSVPFAPFVALLPDGPTQDRLAMLRSARGALEKKKNQQGLLIAVDDAHHLDATSLAFLLGALSHGSATVAITARSSEPMESDLVDLWTNGVVRRIDVDPLDRDRSRELAEATLGRLAPELEQELWRLSEGNPLLLHELIEGARGTVVTQDVEGIWVLNGPLAESARLGDLVTSRLSALSDAVRAAMAVIALGSPVPLPIADLAAGAVVPELEDLGLTAVIDDGEEAALIPAHPLYGEILAANLGQARRREAYGRLAEASVDSASSDVLRAAIWQSRSGTLISPDLALDGAEDALIRHEPALAEQIVRQLGTEDDKTMVILGRALSYQRRFAEAEELLSGRSVEDPTLVGEVASIRAQTLGYGLGRIDEARDLLEDGAVRVEDPTMRARLNNERGMISAISGDFVDVRSASGAVLSDDRSDEVARVAAYVALTVALAMTGDCDGIAEIVDEATELAEAHRADLPFARDQIEIMHAMSLLNAGHVDEAVELGNRAVARADRGSALTTTWLSASGLCLDLAGQLERCAERAEFAVALCRESDPFGLELQCRGLLSLARGQMGDEAAHESIEDAVPLPPAPRLRVWVDRGRAWSAVTRGNIDEGAEIAVSGGARAASGEHFAWATLCFHDAVRLGRPDLALDALRAIDTTKGAHLLSAMKRHAKALVDENPDELTQVAGEFGEMGAPLLAAETWAQASSLYERTGRRTDAACACLLSIAHEARCESPDTPALRDRPTLVSVRETEVALDAASRLTSPQISEKRYISVRTVDNHLRSVYRKLGIGGREELGQILFHSHDE